MPTQRFWADPKTRFEWPNGAVGYGPGGPFDCLGPYAKVINCPIANTRHKVTAYATGYACTYFSIPACCRFRGKYVSGYFTYSSDESGLVFHVNDRHKDRITVA